VGWRSLHPASSESGYRVVKGTRFRLSARGELLIESDSLAIGYWKDEALTLERFKASPDGRRVYHSRDRAMLEPEGMFSVGGRVDNLVKIRGRSVDMDHVEAQVRGFEAIEDVVVSVSGGVLLADIVGSVDRRLLTEYLLQKLPHHAIPRLKFRSELPALETGKPDRSLLALEWSLQEIWAQEFELDFIEPDDDFFELGGDSLVAASLCHRLSRCKGLDVQVAQVMIHRTVRELARQIRYGVPETRNILPLRSGADGPTWVLTHEIGGRLIPYQNLLGLIPPSSPVVALAAWYEFDVERVCISEMARRYVQQLLDIGVRGPYILFGFSFGGLVAHEMAHVFEEQGETVEAVAMLDTCCPAGVKERRSGFLEYQLYRIRQVLHHFSLVPRLGLWPWVEYLKGQLEQQRRERATVSDPKVPHAIALHRAASKRFRPKPVSTRVILFRAKIQLPRLSDSAKLGWESESVEVAEVGGWHGVMQLRTPIIEEIWKRLDFVLALNGRVQ
jgi:thioesterase domain-containing protein